MKSSSGISKYYDQVLEVLIRNAFQKDKTGTGNIFGGDNKVKLKKNYNKILSEARDSVKGQKDVAKENAKTNGTNYSTEWKAVLAEKGVKDEEELLQYFIYKLENRLFGKSNKNYFCSKVKPVENSRYAAYHTGKRLHLHI